MYRWRKQSTFRKYDKSDLLLADGESQSPVKSLCRSNNRNVTISTTANHHYKRALDLIIDTSLESRVYYFLSERTTQFFPLSSCCLRLRRSRNLTAYKPKELARNCKQTAKTKCHYVFKGRSRQSFSLRSESFLFPFLSEAPTI